ncbi:MAG: hypothetical protein H6587_06735 [Flavobacteriales bacterium]|nr:hypothetical protein [Flavobacteriales bacterium]
MFSLTNKVIYILSPNHWGSMHISKHHYAKTLVKKGNVVFFISPPSLKNNFFEKIEVEPNLFVINYYPLFRGKSVLPKFLFNLLIKLQIVLLKYKIGVKPDILWSFTTTLYFNLKWFKANLTIFHPMDQLNTDEAKEIPKNCDIVFSCSDFILNEMSNDVVKKIFISHGIAPSFSEHQFPKIKTTTKTQVGYVGNLFMKNLDRSVLKNLIKSNNDCDFHFFGATNPKESNISAWVSQESVDFIEFLTSQMNVTCHGAIESNQLPEKIDKIDIFLVCYKPDIENIISNSHKVLEYLSTGKTVVSSFIQEYKNSDLIVMDTENSNANYLTNFMQVKNNLATFNSVVNQEKRQQYARQNTYFEKIREIEKSITLLNSKTI